MHDQFLKVLTINVEHAPNIAAEITILIVFSDFDILETLTYFYYLSEGGRKGGTLVHQSKQEFIQPQPTICITPGKQISKLIPIMIIENIKSIYARNKRCSI